MSCPECTKIYAQKRSRIVCLLSCCFCLGFHRIEKRNDIKEKQNVCNTHLPFHFSILCNYFAHENRNYPFCSPAFVFIFFMKEIYFLSKSHSNCFWTKNQFLICYLPDFSPDFFKFLSISLHSCHFSVGK